MSYADLWQPDITYVVGHRRPDTDSIASALGYAWYLQAIGTESVVAASAGPPPQQAMFAVERFGQPPPELLTEVFATFAHAARPREALAGTEPLAEAVSRRAGRDGPAFPVPALPAPSRAYALVQRLRRLARRPDGRELEIEESGLAVLDAFVALSRGASPAPPEGRRPDAAAVRRRRADAVRELLAARFAQRLTLPLIAREVGVSPRVYRRAAAQGSVVGLASHHPALAQEHPAD